MQKQFTKKTLIATEMTDLRPPCALLDDDSYRFIRRWVAKPKTALKHSRCAQKNTGPGFGLGLGWDCLVIKKSPEKQTKINPEKNNQTTVRRVSATVRRVRCALPSHDSLFICGVSMWMVVGPRGIRRRRPRRSRTRAPTGPRSACARAASKARWGGCSTLGSRDKAMVKCQKRSVAKSRRER